MRKLLLAVGVAGALSGLLAAGLLLLARSVGVPEASLAALVLLVAVGGPLVTFAGATVYRSIIRPVHALHERMRRLENRIERMNVDLQASPVLYDRLDVEVPLPALSGWTLTADQGAFLIDQVLSRAPKLALELGSGASTVLIAETMRQAGSGRILSVDHEARYADATRAMLAFRELEGPARVLHCPLAPMEGFDEDVDRVWYDTGFLESLETDSVDLLLVDGPPRQACALSRLPAFPVLREKLSPECVIILDDADRDDERETARRWCEHDPALEAETVPLSTPMAVLRWPAGEKPDAPGAG